MNNPIEVMLDEHEVISSAEEIIYKLDHSWERSEDAFVKHVHSLIRFFREYSDEYHHIKEEQVLFPELESRNDVHVNSLLSELKEHHEMFREYTHSIEGFLNDLQYEKAYTLLCTYMDELLDHIAAENDELFVMAESLFSDTELETMYFKFRDIDNDLGEDRKDQLCNLLKDIEGEIGED